MKKIILMQALLLVASALVWAQEPEKMQPPNSPQQADAPALNNQSVEMKDGKLWLSQDGKITLLSREIILGGSRVSTDGTVELKEGKKITLKNGDKVTSDGVLIMSPDRYAPEQKVPDNK